MNANSFQQQKQDKNKNRKKKTIYCGSSESTSEAIPSQKCVPFLLTMTKVLTNKLEKMFRGLFFCSKYGNAYNVKISLKMVT